jgi:hypothetical protein
MPVCILSSVPRKPHTASQPRGRRSANSEKDLPGVTLTEKFPGSNASRKRKARTEAAPIIPKLTYEAALEFVKLINTGIGPEMAVGYLVPAAADVQDAEERDDLCRKVAAQWYKNPLTLRAINEFNGGSWQDLEPDRRLRVSLDKAYAEYAFFLYSHDYNKLEGIELKKFNDARAAIDERLSGKDSADSPFEKAIREIAAKTGMSPQQMAASTLPIAKTQQ